MIDEELQNEKPVQTSVGTDYSEEASVLKSLKQQLDSIQAENESLKKAKSEYYDAVLNNSKLEEENAPIYRTVKEIREEIIKTKESNTNLRNAELYCELDDACIREQGQSCFLPRGREVTVTQEEEVNAQRVRQMFNECIEVADGDPRIFQLEFDKRVAKPIIR